jgi:diguanylate cyclase (GGDEF)-like protein
MDGTPMPAALLEPAALGRLMPMHLLLDADGTILSAGPTLARITQRGALPGRDFFAAFQVRRPAGIQGMAALRRTAGERLRVTPVRGGSGMRGVAVPLAGGGMLVNLSFGIALADAVREHRLNASDFAPTDLAIELLYLIEAKTAVMNELRALNTRLHGAFRAAEEQALTDTLTGLRNRRAMDMALSDLIASGTDFGLMHLDLDRFKAVNDSLGHAAGDRVLQAVADVLRAQTRQGDTAARIGGDEFVIVFPGVTEGQTIHRVARRIIDMVSQPIDYEGTPCHVSASIGMTLSAFYDTPDCETMLIDADQALYASKHAGRAQATLFARDPAGGASSPDPLY